MKIFTRYHCTIHDHFFLSARNFIDIIEEVREWVLPAILLFPTFISSNFCIFVRRVVCFVVKASKSSTIPWMFSISRFSLYWHERCYLLSFHYLVLQMFGDRFLVILFFFTLCVLLSRAYNFVVFFVYFLTDCINLLTIKTRSNNFIDK